MKKALTEITLSAKLKDGTIKTVKTTDPEEAFSMIVPNKLASYLNEYIGCGIKWADFDSATADRSIEDIRKMVIAASNLDDAWEAGREWLINNNYTMDTDSLLSDNFDPTQIVLKDEYGDLITIYKETATYDYDGKYYYVKAKSEKYGDTMLNVSEDLKNVWWD